MLVSVEGGVPEKVGDHYYLDAHGRQIRDLTADEFHQYQVYQFRGFSGHWMGFYLTLAVFFLFVLPKTEDLERTNSGQPQSPASRDQLR